MTTPTARVVFLSEAAQSGAGGAVASFPEYTEGASGRSLAVAKSWGAGVVDGTRASVRQWVVHLASTAVPATRAVPEIPSATIARPLPVQGCGGFRFNDFAAFLAGFLLAGAGKSPRPARRAGFFSSPSAFGRWFARGFISLPAGNLFAQLSIVCSVAAGTQARHGECARVSP